MVLLVLHIVLLSLAVCLHATNEFQFFSYDPKAYDDASKRLLQGLNNNSKPCENFFDHVCGNFPWQGNKSHEGALVNEALQFRQTGIELIKAIDINKVDTLDYHRHLKVFFDQCLEARKPVDWANIYVPEIMKRLDMSPTNKTKLEESKPDPSVIWNFLGKVKRRFRYDILTAFVLSNGPSAVISTEKCARFTFSPNESQNILAQFFSNEENPEKAIEEEKPKINAFCEEMAKLDDTKHGFARSAHEPAGNGTWTPELPSFDYDQYLIGLIPDANLRQAFLKKTKWFAMKTVEQQGQIFGRHSIRTIRYTVLLTLLANLPEVQLIRDPNHENTCFARASAHFAPAIAKLFLSHTKRDRTSLEFGIRKFMRNIFSAFRFLLNSIDWIDDENRERIQEALGSITVDAGLPRWIDDDREIMRRVITYDHQKNFYENAFDAYANLSDYVFETIANDSFVPQPMHPTGEYPVLDFNANYHHLAYLAMNLGPKLHIQFPFSVSGLYNNDYPTAVSYGGLGMILAHELMHMFSPDQVTEWDYTGRSLLSNTSMPMYTRQQECLAEDYSRFCTADNKHCILGEQTLGENIADVAGLKVAYLAYKAVAMVQHENPRVPGMLHYTNDQLFFIAHARSWCERGYNPLLYEKDVHAPHIARVEVAYRHVQPFAIAFGCQAGTKYVPSKDCNVWGDIANIDKHDLKETNLPSKK